MALHKFHICCFRWMSWARDPVSQSFEVTLFWFLLPSQRVMKRKTTNVPFFHRTRCPLFTLSCGLFLTLGGGSGWGQPWLSRVLRSLPPPPEDNHWLLECESVCRISVIYSRGHFSQPLMLFHYHLCCGVNRKIASLWLRLIAGGISWNCCRCKSDITLSNCDLFFLSRCPTLICSSTPKVN